MGATKLSESEHERLNERIVGLESVVAHLQREMEQLNEVLIEQASGLQTMRQQLNELETRLISSEDDRPEFDPRLDRPPHY